MTKTKSTKRALLSSVLALVLCFSMLVGSTFAWFTDTASTAVNTIQSGTLKIDIQDASGASLEGGTISFVDVNGNANILWEPGCTFNTEEFYIVNNGSLRLRFQFDVSGAIGDVELLDVIDFTAKATVADLEVFKDGACIAAGGEVDFLKGALLSNNSYATEFVLEPNQKIGPLAISGHMRKEAGNTYQGLTVEGLAISLVAAQVIGESDSYDNTYDLGATYLDLPKADVKSNGPSDISEKMIDANQMAFNNSYKLPTPLVLDASYDFLAPATADPDFANWRVDYVVSIDTDIDANSLILAGAYEAAFGDTWVAFTNPIDIAAGQEVPLLTSFYGEEHPFNYEAICNEVKEFKCGVANIDVPAGATLTVELKIFETDENNKNTGVVHTIALVNHKF